MADAKKPQRKTPVEAEPLEKLPVPEESQAEVVSVVGLGASAGGLEALNEFLDAMPPASGFAFVVLQHLDPDHESSLPQILSKHTSMPVVTITDGIAPERDTVYVVPPGFTCIISRSLFHLEKTRDHLFRYPIDHFFDSLATELGPRATGIVLSGTGSDGALGLKAIKAAAGLTLVQEPGTARFDGMPVNAAPYADVVLPISAMPQQLREYRGYSSTVLKEFEEHEEHSDEYLKVLYFLQAHTGYDFSMYKMGTIRRRIERRMVSKQLTRLSDYAAVIKEQPDEADVLLGEILINVTSFFRDPEAFAALTKQLSAYITAKDATPLRVWVIGCSTGEEAYSVAICVNEIQESLKSLAAIQIFASDLDRHAVEVARHGVYPENIVAQLTEDRLKRFFIRHEDAYRINQRLRDQIVFAPHNVLTDPPFTHIDLICCRNLLIYLNPAVQKKLIALMHYSLNPGGLLFLGQSETAGANELFIAADRKSKIYRRTDVPSPAHLVPPFNASSIRKTGALPVVSASPHGEDVIETVKRLVAEKFAPAYVLLDTANNVLYVSGDTSKYLRLAPGETRWNVLDMARDDLRARLTVSLHEARRRGSSAMVSSEPVPVSHGGIVWLVSLETQQMASEGNPVLLVFRDLGRKEKARVRAGKAKTGTVQEGLEYDLKIAQDSLQSNIVELAKANEDLKVANEELQSSNEELQSSNEELETSREELRSINEELISVNAEDNTRITDLARASDDLRNLLDNTDIATIFIDRDFRIRSFTSAATNLFPMIGTDIGRPLKDINSSLDYYKLGEDFKSVLQTLTPLEKVITTKENRVFQMRIKPYRTADKAIAGLVLAFLDIDDKTVAQAALNYSRKILDTLREAIMVLDGKLRVVSANRAFYRLFQLVPSDAEGKVVFELGGKGWDIPELRKLLGDILTTDSQFEDYLVSHEFPAIGRKTLLLNARRLFDDIGDPHIVVAFEDVTRRSLTGGKAAAKTGERKQEAKIGKK